MEETSQDYTACSTPFGSFRWLQLPIGLTGSPPTFQCLVEQVPVALTWKHWVPYPDKNIIFPSTLDENLERLRLVFERFRAQNLKINPDECDFFSIQVQFLGHIKSKEGLEVNPNNMEAVQNFPEPRSQTEVKPFLGFASCFRRFVPTFGELARPLHNVSGTTTKFEWIFAAQNAFESLKLTLTSTPILAFPCLKEPFIIYTDASQFAMGALNS